MSSRSRLHARLWECVALSFECVQLAAARLEVAAWLRAARARGRSQVIALEAEAKKEATS